MKSKTILILGAGTGGLIAANELRQKLPQTHRIILVEKNPQHAFAPSFLWLMTGDRKPHQVTRPLQSLVRPGIEIVTAEVTGMDTQNHTVETTRQKLNYDYLIIALGADLAEEALPGLSRAAHTFYEFQGAIALHDALNDFKGGKVAVVIASMPYKCPGAPYEGALLIADFFSKKGIRDKIEMNLITPEPQPLPVAGPALGVAVKQMLENKGIKFHPGYRLKEVHPDKRELHFENNPSFGYDLLVAIPPHRAPGVLRQSGLTNDAGWIPVDRGKLTTNQPDVYAIGDVTAIPIPGRWKPEAPLSLPKAGVFAHGQAQVVARRIAGEIRGTAVDDIFCGDGFCMLEAGEDLAGFAYGDFFAAPAPQVNLHKLGKIWHIGKVLFESWWLAPYGVRRSLYKSALKIGSKTVGMPVEF